MKSFYTFSLLFVSFPSSIYSQFSHQSLDIDNNSAQQINITANSVGLQINHQVPAYSHSRIIASITSLNNPNDMLLRAIIANSSTEIIDAIRTGANVNHRISGKTPLEWAIFLDKLVAVKTLVLYGAIL